MKKAIFTISLLVLVVLSGNAQIKFGVGASLGTKVGLSDTGSDKMGFGLNARANYLLSEKFEFSGGITYFFPSAPSGITLNLSQVNVDAHYSFLTKEKMSLYGLAGLNYSFAKAKVSGYEASDNKIGADLGAGILFNKKLFGEVKYDTAIEQIAVTVGYIF